MTLIIPNYFIRWSLKEMSNIQEKKQVVLNPQKKGIASYQGGTLPQGTYKVNFDYM